MGTWAIDSMEQVKALRPMDDPDSSLPFIRQILTNLRSEVGNASTVLGFVGAPWTLAAYSMEGSFNKCVRECPAQSFFYSKHITSLSPDTTLGPSLN